MAGGGADLMGLSRGALAPSGFFMDVTAITLSEIPFFASPSQDA